MERDCLQHTCDDWFHAGEVNAPASISVYEMRQIENRTVEVHPNPRVFALGLIEAVPGHNKLTTYLSRHILHAGSSKKIGNL